MKLRMINILNAVFLAIMIAFNFIVNKIPLFGFTTSEVSVMFPTLISPALYAFSIWGVIYLLLTMFVIYSFTRTGKCDPVIKNIEGLFVSSCILNMIWLVFWHSLQIPFSVGIMCALLVCLCQIYVEIKKNKQAYDKKQKLFVLLPFSVYLAWVCTATVSNVAAAIVYMNPYLLSEAFWSILMGLFLCALAIFVGYKYRDCFFTFTMCWATFAIAIKNIPIAPLSIIMFAISGILFIISFILLFRAPRREVYSFS